MIRKTSLPMRPFFLLLLAVLASGVASAKAFAADPPPKYGDVQPLLTKYCAGCHGEFEANGELRLDSYEAIIQGGKHGPALVAGDSGVSRMIRMLTGKADPQMPPKDEAQPTAAEIERIAAWIDAGAAGPDGTEPIAKLSTPDLGSAKTSSQPVTALAISADGSKLAVARFATVEVVAVDPKTGEKSETLFTLKEHPGKVNDLAFSADGNQLLAASGVVGLRGEAIVWDLKTGKPAKSISGHKDTLYAVAISPDGSTLATGSYDRKVILWDLATAKPIHTLTQHNAPIYDLAFSPDGTLLASASGDETVKIWHVKTGERLDTLGQPEGEQYAVLFSPDGKLVIAGGADNRIRVWEVVSKEKPQINPLKFARFAHEGGVVSLAWNNARNVLISAADDRTLKTWETETFTETKLYDVQPAIVSAVATSQSESANDFWVARLDGSLQRFPDIVANIDREPITKNVAPTMTDETEMAKLAEAEPNDDPKTATPFTAPGTATGVIHSTDPAVADTDLFRFSAKAGQQWILETKAARMKSPLDTKIEVLTAGGERIERVRLQAVRDSYFTFRGKDGNQTGDFRLHNWEEMQLNQLLFASGEVVKLYTYPRGPDSGFNVYPNFGSRHTYFDTTSVAHALGEPAYIVEPHDPSEKLIPNGLPVFPIYFENDDDAEQKFGTDSKLTFTAPADGEYLVRVKDTRGFGGEAYKYELTIRPPRPDFVVRLEGTPTEVNAGSGRMFKFKAVRTDNFDGEIEIEISDVPAGYFIPSPLTIQAGQFDAEAAIYAFPDATQQSKEAWEKVKLVARAKVNPTDDPADEPEGNAVTEKNVGSFGEVKLLGEPKLLLTLSDKDAEASPPGTIPEITIRPGQTLPTLLRVDRKGNNGVLSFGKEDAGRNLPHGVFVDNIGLNGVLLLPGQDQREVFITADTWVPGTERLFFLKSDQEGGQCSWPVKLKVVE